MTSRTQLLDQPQPADHLVQLYGSDDRLLTQNVGRYLIEGLRRGDGIVVIATPEHRVSLVRQLRGDTSYTRAVLEGRLAFLDAEATLNRLLSNGRPDAELFGLIVGKVVQGVRMRASYPGVRAYGEMVGLLWQRGEYESAIALEGLWNELLQRSEVSLFCGYPIDVLSPECQGPHLEAVLCAHTHLLTVDNGEEAARDLRRSVDGQGSF